MRRILFVDDEPKILEGLERMLRAQRKQWRMTFVNSGEAALKALATEPFDVIVTDMRMPGMDGARLLELVLERFPAVIRIVLSGYFDVNAALRAVPVAHQFLMKPSDPEILRTTIERLCACGSIVTDDATRRIVAAIGELPSLPRNCVALMRALEDPDSSLDRVGAIVEEDVAISAKVLQLVNSAFFGLSHEIATVRMAVGYLGVDVLRQLVLSVEIFRAFALPRHIQGFSLEGFQLHSRLAAAIAARLPVAPDLAAASTVAALLHDAGYLVLASRLPDRFVAALEAARRDQRPLHQVETELMGTNHAGIGAYLLGLWGLPAPVVQAVASHHQPMAVPTPGALNLASAVHLADGLAREAAAFLCASPIGPHGFLDPELVNSAGIEASLPAWRELAAQLAARQESH